MGGHAELTAAYRFFNNPKTEFGKILEPHIEATERRVAEHEEVIVAQDTTEIDMTRPQQRVEGSGPLDKDCRWGAFLHTALAFTPEGTMLGLVYGEAWAREEEEERPSREERRKLRRAKPIEEKESIRWLNGLKATAELAGRQPQTHFVCVADSESDVYEYLVAAASYGQKLSWIVRAAHDRALAEDEGQGESNEGVVAHLRERLLREPVLFRQTIDVRGREPKVSCDKRRRRGARKSRKAVVEVRAGRVRLRPPQRLKGKVCAVTVNAVLVTEVDPPADDEPVEWILLTNMPIEAVEQVEKIIASYATRWMCEVYHRTLKTGCRVERRRFESLEAMLNCLAVYMIVAWRTLYVTWLGREFPELSCEAVFEECEWKAAYWVVRKKRPPAKPPKLQQMVRIIAQLGGYANLPSSGEPGAQAMWIGLQRTFDLATCWELFGPAKHKSRRCV